MKKRWTFALLMLVVMAALALRLPRLDQRPMHGDEAIHAVKFSTLWQAGQYQYDPTDYHGPTLYYFTLPAVWLDEARDFAHTRELDYRIVTALFGAGLILLLWPIAEGLAPPATLCAGVLTALSPAMSFYSRYYIQEMLLVVFTFALIVCGWRYVRTRSPAWAILAGLSMGLMHATKETDVIAWFAMVIALAGTLAWGRWIDRKPVNIRPWLNWRVLGLSLLAGLAVAFVLLSGCFTHLRGPLDSVFTYGSYLHRSGGAGIHDQPWDFYLQTLLYTHLARGPVWTEGLILGLAGVGLAAVVLRRGLGGANVSLVRFLAIYTLVMTAVYSLIPYKTPWCMLSFLQGMILLAGLGAAALVRWAPTRPVKLIIALILSAGACQLGVQAYRANFQFEADPRNPYVYAQPVRDVFHLVQRVQDVACVHPASQAMPITVIAANSDYWPLPWYLRSYANVGYWNHPPAQPDAAMVIVSPSSLPALAGKLRDAYNASPAGDNEPNGESFGLRPGVPLLAYTRADLWQAMVQGMQPAPSTNAPAGESGQP